MSLVCSLPVLATILTSCGDPEPLATGYVEGEFTLVAPVATAQIADVAVTRGEKVAAGATLATMEERDTQIALAQADANLAQAESALANLLEGAREAEIEVIEATLASARLRSEEAARTRDRLVSLAERGVVTDAQRDDAITSAQVAEANVAQVAAELAVARLPARPQAIAEAKAAVRAAEAARDQAQWALDQRILTLPEPVTIMDIVRREGEIAGPSSPVLSVLGDGAVKLRLYMPESAFSQVAIGDELSVGCDNCAPELKARVSYISDEPEFTPPVIYSLENRQKLVYLVEARPEGDHLLKPGQIVDVRLPGGAE